MAPSRPSRSAEQTLNINCLSHSGWQTEPVCPKHRHGHTHPHTRQGLRGSWRCSHTAALAECRRGTSRSRARPAAGHTPGSTGSHPAREALLRDTEGQDWGKGRACHTAGTTPAQTSCTRHRLVTPSLPQV